MSYILPTMILIGTAVNIVISTRNAKTPAVRRFVVATQLAGLLLAVVLVIVPAILRMNERLSMKIYLGAMSLFFLIIIPFELWSRKVIRRKS